MENGRRLENMSWRLWYRESTLKESRKDNKTPLSTSCPPIPIQSVSTATTTTDKHLSTASYKRLISSINEKDPVIPPVKPNTMILFEKPKQQTVQKLDSSSKFFINDDDSDNDEGWSSEDDDESTPKNTVLHTVKSASISQEEDDEMAFLSEFKKRSPIANNVITNGYSLLSNMLRAQNASTRLDNQLITVTQNQNCYIVSRDEEELSASMRKCVEWEHYQHDFILNSNVKVDTLNVMNENSVREYW